MNCVFFCVFNQPKFLELAYLLLESIYRYGALTDTEILIYTSSDFKAQIESSPWMSDKVRIATNDSYNDVTSACKARLDLFEIPAATRYEKFLYLDTDIIVKDSLQRVFDLVEEDLLYVLAAGEIDAPSDAFGRTLFGAEVELHQDKRAFTSAMMAFRNSERMRDFFAAVKKDIRDRPGKFHCHDQPYIVYNAFKYALFDNQKMKLVAANDCYDQDSDLVLHHFPGIAEAGEYGHKLMKMRRYLENLEEAQIYRKFVMTGKSDLRTGAALIRLTTRHMLRRVSGRGEIRVPTVPSMLEHYVDMCDSSFRNLGVQFSTDDIDRLREALRTTLAAAYAASPNSEVIITYECPGDSLAGGYNITWRSAAAQSAFANRVPPSGGSPDARVSDLADAAGDPVRVLDIGAGIGRNSLALARRGHHVDAVEMTPKFAEILHSEAQREGLDVRVIGRDVFTLSAGDLRTDYDLVLLSGVVPGFHATEQLRKMFELAARSLGQGGRLLFNTFLPRDGYIPDAVARELGQQCHTSIFTYPDLSAATAGLPLTLMADEAVCGYEKSRLPADAWPPAPWYERWAQGLDLFETTPSQSPIELRWLLYRRN